MYTYLYQGVGTKSSNKNRNVGFSVSSQKTLKDPNLKQKYNKNKNEGTSRNETGKQEERYATKTKFGTILNFPREERK